MGKAIIWIIVVFAVLFCLRMYNVSQQKKREDADAAPPGKGKGKAGATGEAMVRCTRCGVFLPRSEAQFVEGKIRCRDKDCK